MQRYENVNSQALRLRETYSGGSGGEPTDIYFSEELKAFKRSVRSSVDSLRDLLSENDSDFNTEQTKSRREEELRLLKFITFCRLDESERPEGGDFHPNEEKLETVRKFIGKMEERGVRDFRVTPVSLYRFDHKEKKSTADLFVKVYNKRNGRNFFVDLNCRVVSSLNEFAEESVGDFLVCFPKDGSYDIDPQLGKVPLEFRSFHSSSSLVPKVYNCVKNVISIALDLGQAFSPFPFIFIGLGIVFHFVGVLVEKYVLPLVCYGKDKIQRVYNTFQPFVSSSLRLEVGSSDSFNSEPNNSLRITDVTYLNIIKEMDEAFRVDSYPYEKTKKLIGKSLEGIPSNDERALISILNSASEEYKTGIDGSTGGESESESGDCTLESFRNRTQKRDWRRRYGPGWRFSLKPADGNVSPSLEPDTGSANERVILEVEFQMKQKRVVVICTKERQSK